MTGTISGALGSERDLLLTVVKDSRKDVLTAHDTAHVLCICGGRSLSDQGDGMGEVVRGGGVTKGKGVGKYRWSWSNQEKRPQGVREKVSGTVPTLIYHKGFIDISRQVEGDLI